MKVCDIQLEETADYRQITANIIPQKFGPNPLKFWIRHPSDFDIAITADPFIASFLIPCMVLGEDLFIDAEASPTLVCACDRIQNLITSWFPERSRVSLTCTGEYTPKTLHGKKAASLFSGGIDSWYTLLKVNKEIDYLVLIRGFDIHINNHKKWGQTRTNAAREAAQMGKSLLTVETNLSSLYPLMGTEWSVNWGGSLATIGLFLQNELSTFFISSEGTFKSPPNTSTNSEMDPLWSTEALQVVHYGAVSRLDKIRHIHHHYPQAFNSVRVCNRIRNERYNCCKCEKCLRTMAGLRLCGALESATAFPKSLELKRFSRILGRKQTDVFEWELLNEAKSQGDDELAEALEVALGLRFSFVRLIVVSTIRLRKLFGKIARRCCPRVLDYL